MLFDPLGAGHFAGTRTPPAPSTPPMIRAGDWRFLQIPPSTCVQRRPQQRTIAPAAGDAWRSGEISRRVAGTHPGQFQSRHSLGQVLQQQGRSGDAEQAYLAAIKTKSDYEFAYNSLARLLATCPDDKVRDGKRAVEYATTACERTGWKNPPFLDTLAAAYAAAGEFEEAVRYQTRAMDDPALRGDLRVAATQRLELYRQKKPFRDPGP